MATSKAKGPKGDGKRSHKVGEAVRAELMNMLLAGEVHDPAVSNVMISAVVLTDDLRLAKVYVRLLDFADEASQTSRAALLKGLERAKGYLRREVAHRVNLRYAPELRFYWDESIDRGRDIEALLREINRDDDGST